MPDARIEAFWAAFRAAGGVAHDRYDVAEFGDSPAMKDALAALIAAGRKRATASLAASCRIRAGDLSVVADGAGAPVCVIRATEVRTGPLTSVDDAFAWDEGEGDRSRACWLAEHRAFFAREAARGGWTMHDGVAVAFERFAVIWPPELAD